LPFPFAGAFGFPDRPAEDGDEDEDEDEDGRRETGGRGTALELGPAVSRW